MKRTLYPLCGSDMSGKRQSEFAARDPVGRSDADRRTETTGLVRGVLKMLRRTMMAIALGGAWIATSSAADPLAEVRKSFTIGGKPVPPEIFSDFGDAMMSDSRPIVVTVDASAAVGSNRYADPITTNGRWVEQTKPDPTHVNGPESIAYEYHGATANGLLVAVTAYNGGGSGVFHYLHILDAASRPAFNDDGSRYSRLDLTLVRTYSLGDRWEGELTVSGNSVRIRTDASLGGKGGSTMTIEARRP